MTENPIMKFNSVYIREGVGKGRYEINRSGPRKRRRWGFRCPVCKSEQAGWDYGTWSRKVARDRLHRHMMEEHGGPGLGV